MAGADRVGFLIAGVQKGGTSALHDYLRDVPELQLPAIKEAHHFDDESIDWRDPDHGGYHALFENDGRLWGEATPIYCYWPNSIERIRRYNPAMRLILIVRDPIDRAWSHWKMEYARRKETMPFAWCIREGRARVDSAEAPGHHRVFSYVERGLYGEQLARISAQFPAEQLLLLRNEDLDRDPARVIEDVCRFLDVPSPRRTIEPRRVRVAADICYPSILTGEDQDLLREIYASDVGLFQHRTGWDLSGSWRVTASR